MLSCYTLSVNLCSRSVRDHRSAEKHCLFWSHSRTPQSIVTELPDINAWQPVGDAHSSVTQTGHHLIVSEGNGTQNCHDPTHLVVSSNLTFNAHKTTMHNVILDDMLPVVSPPVCNLDLLKILPNEKRGNFEKIIMPWTCLPINAFTFMGIPCR